MSFYFSISDRTLKFGGLKSIAQDWGYVEQSASRIYKEPDGNISSPLGMWVIGTAMKANFVLTKLRLQNHWTDDELISLAGVNDVKICVATDKRFYLYRNSARSFTDYIDGWHTFLTDCTRETFIHAANGKNVPKHWETCETNYF